VDIIFIHSHQTVILHGAEVQYLIANTCVSVAAVLVEIMQVHIPVITLVPVAVALVV
jgi:hypothetical protein